MNRTSQYIKNMEIEYKNMARAYARLISYNEKITANEINLTALEKDQYKIIRNKLVKKVNRDCFFVNNKLQGGAK